MMKNNRNNMDHNDRALKLCHAVVMSFNDRKGIGISKYDERKKHNEKIRAEAGRNDLPWEASPLLHSDSTLNQYIYVGQRYAKWLAEAHPDVFKLSYAYKKGYAREYIQLMIDSGKYAPSSINRTTSVLAKLYHVHAWDIHDNRAPRRYKDFTRSRNYCEAQYRKDLKKYEIIAEICRATGVREKELKSIYPESFHIDSNGELYLFLDSKRERTKGGRPRKITILEKSQERMREILASLPPGERICPKPPSHMDIHGIRSLYAMDFYATVARNINDIPTTERIPLKHPKIDNSRPGKVRSTAPGIYVRRSDGRKFDRRALLIVSQSLGHNRVDVVVHSYLR